MTLTPEERTRILGEDLRWMDAAPVDGLERYEYYTRLVYELAQQVSEETLELCIAKALPSHGVKRTG